MKRVLLGFLFSVIFLGLAHAHISKDTVQCALFGPLTPKGIPKVLQQKMLPNGLLAELYDINQDGRPDIAVYSATYGIVDIESQDPEQINHSIAPILYEIDFPPQEESPDVVYIDIHGTQVCTDLVLYQDLKNTHERASASVIMWDGIAGF